MSDAYKLTLLLFEEYGQRTAFGNEDDDEAVQNSVDWVFRTRTDEFRSDLYSKIKEAWDKCEPNAQFLVAEKLIAEALNG